MSNNSLRDYQSKEEFISFNAMGKKPYHLLSNFSFIKEGIEINGLIFPSTEHAFQSFKYIDEDKIRFSIKGDLGNIETGFQLVFGDSDYKSKMNYWMKKDNIGIIAKMATNEKIGKKLGLRRNKNFESSFDLWISILNKKYQLEPFKSILKSTKNLYLLEFDRGSKRMEEKYQKKNFWAGLIDDNKLYGENHMGKYIMYIRNDLSLRDQLKE